MAEYHIQVSLTFATAASYRTWHAWQVLYFVVQATCQNAAHSKFIEMSQSRTAVLDRCVCEAYLARSDLLSRVHVVRDDA